jgi:putative membrane protein
MRRVNIDAVLKITILVGFSLFFYMIIHTGKVELYVHPRIVPYIKFGMAAMLFIAIFMIKDIFKINRKKVNVANYAMFIIPLVMAFSIQAKAMDSTDLAGKNINISEQSTNTQQDNTTGGGASTASSIGSNSSLSNAYQNQISPQPKVLQMQGDTVVVTENDFVPWLNEISSNLDKYDGKKIQITGFVYKHQSYKENEFVVGRFMMTCCTADLQLAGLMCNYTKASNYKNDTWVKISGKIKKVDYKGQKINIIVVDAIEKADKPQNQYVYPY